MSNYLNHVLSAGDRLSYYGEILEVLEVQTLFDGTKTLLVRKHDVSSVFKPFEGSPDNQALTMDTLKQALKNNTDGIAEVIQEIIRRTQDGEAG